MIRLLMLALPILLISCGETAEQWTQAAPPSRSEFRDALSAQVSLAADTDQAKAMAAALTSNAAQEESPQAEDEPPQERPRLRANATWTALCSSPLPPRLRARFDDVAAHTANLEEAVDRCSSSCPQYSCDGFEALLIPTGRIRAGTAALADRLAALSLVDPQAEREQFIRLKTEIRERATETTRFAIDLAGAAAKGEPLADRGAGREMSRRLMQLAYDVRLLAWEDRLRGSSTLVITHLEDAAQALARALAVLAPSRDAPRPVPAVLAEAFMADLFRAGDGVLAAMAVLDTLEIPAAPKASTQRSDDGTTPESAASRPPFCSLALAQSAQDLGPRLDAALGRLEDCARARGCRTRHNLQINVATMAEVPLASLSSGLEADVSDAAEPLNRFSSASCE